MKHSLKNSVLACLAVLATSSGSAKPLTFGYANTALESDSQTILTIPFNQQAVAKGAIADTPIVVDGLAELTMLGNIDWDADAYAQFHYIRFLDGAIAGHYLTIESNASNSVIVDQLDLDLSLVEAGDHYEIAPYWTLDYAFPIGINLGLYIPQVDKDKAYPQHQEGYLFSQSEGWVTMDKSRSQAGSTILYPDSFVIVEQPKHAADTVIRTQGLVNTSSLKTAILADEKDHLYNPFAFKTTKAIRLGDTDLSNSFVESPSASSPANGDELRVYQASSRNYRANSYRSFFRHDEQWYEKGGELAEDFVIPAGSGLAIVKDKGEDTITYVTSSQD